MLAFYVQRQMQRAWALMLFADELPPGRAGRLPVAPARRSASAGDNAHTEQRPGGHLVHSFRTLFGELATLARNRARPAGADDSAALDLTTIPAPLQREALERLGIIERV